VPEVESVMLVMGNAAEPLFVTVIGFDALATLMVSLPNASEVGEVVYVEATPVPLSATVCVPAPPPAFTLKVAVADPTEAGSNTTLIVQLAPAATEVPQVLVCENG
jgi:hypothetical protein